MIFDVELNSAAFYPARDVVRLAEIAEASGFQAVWKGESNSTDPLILLSAIAARTSTIKLGTAIYHIWGRSPVTLGIQVATLQDLSGGRLLLGLGAGNKTIAGWHGGEFGAPVARMREYVDIVRQVARGDRPSGDRKYYSTGDRFKLSWQPSYPDVPVYIAGLGPLMTKLAGGFGDGVVLNMTLPSKIREIAERVRGAAAEAGRDPNAVQIVGKVRVSLHPDRDVARGRLRQVLTFYNIADYYSDMLRGMGFEDEVNAIHKAFKEGGFKAAAAALTDDYFDRLPVIAATSAAEVKERLQPFLAAGATRMVIPYVPATDDVVADCERFLRAWGTV